jgi:sigma-B regulation protein RsbU (phosphoserine phosphatase)
LGSALLAVTVLEFLRSQIRRDFDFAKPAQVIERLNRIFQMKDHAGKFFSVWYGVYSRSARTITYINAGHPPALLLIRDGDSPRLVRTAPSGPVLGVLPEINAPEITVPFPPEAEIYLFTDGLYELLDRKGGHGSYDEFMVHLEAETKHRRSLWEAMLEWSASARARGSVDDDVSLMRFTAPV